MLFLVDAGTVEGQYIGVARQAGPAQELVILRFEIVFGVHDELV